MGPDDEASGASPAEPVGEDSPKELKRHERLRMEYCKWPPHMLVVCLGFAGLFAGLYPLLHLGPSSIEGKQSWIDQIIDSSLIIALLRVVVVGGVVFIVASILKAAAENRALVSFFGGARIAEAKDEGISALRARDGMRRDLFAESARADRLEHELDEMGRLVIEGRIKLTEAEAAVERKHKLLMRFLEEDEVAAAESESH
jgi:hypothetical protein